MFLKNQEDLHKLLERYPIDTYSINIHGGENRAHPPLGILCNTLTISSKENRIILTAYNDDKHEYNEDGIQVLNIFRKTKQNEGLAREYPIMLNGKWLIDINYSEPKRKRKEDMILKFYNSIEEFSNHYNGLKEQLRLLDRLELDEIFSDLDELNHNSDMRTFYFYYQQSQSDYFAGQYFKLIDKDPQSFNFDKILDKARTLEILQESVYSGIIQDLEKFRDSDIRRYRNKYGAHTDKSMFYQYNRSQRISATGVQQTRFIAEPPIFREKLWELMDFIDKIINDYFSPQIRLGRGGDSGRQFILKLIQKN